ncbi:hypothetical protein [Streptomyces sp. DH24]|uniref:hypothetical protein n=1 Tax=Streptomyces sp. DH24 TaxID=3040123 RepID=UPI002442AC3A|nr:hypothetical protein [Streptomyces sp. DH24]MDG9716769.1 hypothetical protein [Streptomyces sp. DH24]
MRLPARRLATTTLSAFLLLGVTGPAAVAAGSDTSSRPAAVSQAPVADAKALLAQTRSLGDMSHTLKPATDLLEAVLKADNGRLTPQESAKHADAVKDAITKAGAAAPAGIPATTLPAPATAKAPAPDLKATSLNELQKSVDSLLKSATSGDSGQVQPGVTGVLSSLVNFVTATLLGSGLPAPDMAGLPALPALPSSQQSTENAPAQSPQHLPAGNPQTGNLPVS